MANIDDEIINALHQDNNAELKRIVGFGKIEIKTEEDIGKKRTADILVTILNYPGKEKQEVVIEVENDRGFEVGPILRKIKRNRRYPTIVIIPKEFERFAWRFQEADIHVWYWIAKCKWLCRGCNEITTSTSSLTPARCAHCNKGGNFFLRWAGADVKFEKAEDNPSLTYQEYEAKYGRKFRVGFE